MSNQAEFEYLKKGNLFITENYYLSCYLKTKGGKYLGIRLIENPRAKEVKNDAYKYRFVFFPEVSGEENPQKSLEKFKELLDKWNDKDNYEIRLVLEASSALKHDLKNLKQTMSDNPEKGIKEHLLPLDEETKKLYKEKSLPFHNIGN